MQPPFTKSNQLQLFQFRSPHTRVFHVTWITFFLCFFGWFGIAPLMPVIREDLGLTKEQIGYVVVASVSITIFARLLFGWLCDRIGPRKSYTTLLLLGSIPVMTIGFSDSFTSFLLFRLAIGMIGASFVITQYHTASMYASNVVGTANSVSAGWGNMGGGATLILMPLIFSAFASLGFSSSESWRYAMIVPGFILLVMAFVYYFFTEDAPRETKGVTERKSTSTNPWADYRVWVLFVAYAACFGIEITIDNIAALYFVDNFQLGLKEAGLIAGLFGMMNIFARALGGIFGDKAGNRFGLRGRILALAAFLALEGIGIVAFSSMTSLTWAVAAMLGFALFLKMSNGATYAVVPFINKQKVGIVSGIVGAGGNVGAVIAGMLFASELSYRESFTIIGYTVIVVAGISFLLSFSINEIARRIPGIVSSETNAVGQA